MSFPPRSAGVVLVTADALTLAAARHCPSTVWAHGRHLRAWFAADRPDGVVATLAGAVIWVVALWLAIGLVATAVTHVPGVAGTVARGVSRVMVPRAVRALLLGTAGLGVLLTPAVAGASPAPSASLPAPRWPVAATSARPAPDPPSSTPPSTQPASTPPSSTQPSSTPPSSTPPSSTPPSSTPPASTQPSSSLPAPTWPSTAPASRTPTDLPRPAHPTPAATRSATPEPSSSTVPTPARTATPTSDRPAAPHRSATAHGDEITVRTGDSLWLLAAHRLAGPRPLAQVSPGRVAREWPRWYRANRDVLRGDPDLLVPGQVLRVPAAIPAGGEAQ